MGESTNPRREANEYVATGAVLNTGGRRIDAGVIVGKKLPPLIEYRRVEDLVMDMTHGLHRDLLLDTLRGIHEDILNKMTGGDDE